MPKRIYVGNLPRTITRSQLRDAFSKFGTVSEVTLSRDGTAKVEMSTGADEAMTALHQQKMDGKTLEVIPFTTHRGR